ncbi:serine hydrolase domain-containing protein [Phenylobacterium montanum]|uniref:Beta-lactamase family protein n=1 Tax=Phenylobacterium montanum TaxID=2823693 RepID=A0A975G2V6_9CAUL|nr:serine hydrolase domain-containing protein [Caulobacter sp. S6]QUD89006.1 beta-lactamase family protein [Caulobacter sp. S6]
MKNKKIGCAAALAFTAAVSASSAQAQTQALKPAFEAQLKQHGVVGGGLAFVHGPAPAALILSGDARTEPRQAIDAETAYNWASITKTFTAIAILQLRDRGLLSLDDPITKYVPELRQVHDAYGSPDAITIRQLLTHSAGFRNPTWPWDCDDAKDCTWQPFEPTRWTQVAAMLPYTHVAFPPGSRWSYSNPGYVFLGQVIERLSGDDFEVYVDKNILKPLGMADSYFDRAPYFLQGHVSASWLRAGSRLEAQPFDYDTGITTSNSGLKAPLPDMVKYLRFLVGEPGNARYETVLKRSSLEEMWRGEVPVTEPGEAATAYTETSGGKPPMMGLGFFVMERNGHRYIYHDGDQAGFSSELLVDPDGKSAAILVVNTTDTGAETPASTHAISNTDPDPATDLRKSMRAALVDKVFPAAAKAP